MKIEVENIGPIKKAEVEIGGLTVIAGRNSTGKSTIGKLIYVAINSFIRDEDFLKKIQQANLKNEFFQRMFKMDFPDIKDPLNITAKEINECLKKQPGNSAMQTLRNMFDTTEDRYRKAFAINYRSNIGSFFNNTYFRFGTSKNNICLISDDKKKSIAINMTLNTDLNAGVSEPIEVKNYDLECTDGIKDVYVINDKQIFTIDKKAKQDPNSNIPAEIVDSLLIDIERTIGGTIKFENNMMNFIENNYPIGINNVADGIQQFAKLFQFIKVNQSTSSTMLVFDEPEVHLHPAWQLKMAEILVLVAKRLYVPLLINTHSDIMLKGLKEYSKKHGYTHTKFYHAKNDGNGCVINNVEMDDIDIITEDLASPYYNIIDLRMENS